MREFATKKMPICDPWAHGPMAISCAVFFSRGLETVQQRQERKSKLAPEEKEVWMTCSVR